MTFKFIITIESKEDFPLGQYFILHSRFNKGDAVFAECKNADILTRAGPNSQVVSFTIINKIQPLDQT